MNDHLDIIIEANPDEDRRGTEKQSNENVTEDEKIAQNKSWAKSIKSPIGKRIGDDGYMANAAEGVKICQNWMVV